MKLKYLIGIVIILISTVGAHAQENPPRPLTVYVNPLQGLNFGAFFQGTVGGSVIIYANGSRSITGDIIQANLGYPFSPAIFEIDADPGTRISILNGPNETLSGTNGGSIMLQIGESDHGSSFITTAIPPARTEVRIGGTLTVGSPLANPSGSYNGTFQIIFMQE